MLRMGFAFAVLLVTLTLAGCATLSKVECQAGDWRGIGISDGNRGLWSSRFEQHVDACAEYGVVPNRELYMAGYNEGLKNYCQLDKAARIGTDGGVYRQVCSGEIGLSFGRVYVAARDVYLARDEADSIRDEIDDVTRELTQPDVTDAARVVLGQRMSSLQRSLDRQRDVISREERDLRDVLAGEVRRLNALGISA